MSVENPSDYIPTIEKYQGEFEMVLKQSVSSYRNGPAVVSLEKVQTEKLQILTPLIREYKIRQIDVLTELISNAGFKLFEPLEVLLSNGRRSVITPPVVEEIGGNFYVIEGNTRSFQCGQNRIPEFVCAVVRNVQMPLPREPFPLSHAQITAHNKNPHLKHRDLFRPIEESLHPI